MSSFSDRNHLNEGCLIDLKALPSVSDLRYLVGSTGSFNGRWLIRPVDEMYQEALDVFDINGPVRKKALWDLFYPSTGFRGFNSSEYQESDNVKELKIPWTTFIGSESRPFEKVYRVDKDEHFEFAGLGPRSGYFPVNESSILEALSILSRTGTTFWVVDDYLRPWEASAEHPKQRNQLDRLHIINEFVQKLQTCASNSMLIMVGRQERGDCAFSKNSVEIELKKIIKRSNFRLVFYLDHGPTAGELASHRRYVICRHGAIHFEYGLTTKVRHGTEVAERSYLSKSAFEEVYAVYSQCRPTIKSQRFELICNV